MKWRIYFCLSIGLLLSTLGSSQVVIQPTFRQAEIFSIDQLLQVSIINSAGRPVEGTLDVSIESGRQLVFRLASPMMQLGVGEMRFADEINWNSQFQFGQNDIAGLLRSTGKLYGDNLTFCYHFIENQTGKVLGSSCQEKALLRFDPPELIFPTDRSQVKTELPLLTWKPLNLLSFSTVSYQLILTELKAGQSPIQAVQTNGSIINERHLFQPFLPYPTTALPLEKDKKYAWQVTAFLDGVEIGKTEAWQFSLKETPTTKQYNSQESYRFAKKQPEGKYYIANRILHFAFDNRDYEEQLDYKLYPVKANGQKSIKKLPIIPLKHGVNQLDLDLSNFKGVKDNQAYLLVIQTKKNGDYYLPFKYYKKTAK